MSTAKILTVDRYVSDERAIVFYIIDSLNRTIILSGAVLSCTFSDATAVESDVVQPIILYAGDGRAHIPVTAAQVSSPIVWDMFITGTDGSGASIEPIKGRMTVVAV